MRSGDSGKNPRHIRRQALARAGNRCQWCGRKPEPGNRSTRLEVDHIIPQWAGGPTRPDNLQVLCRACHHRKTVVDTYWLENQRRVRRREKLVARLIQRGWEAEEAQRWSWWTYPPYGYGPQDPVAAKKWLRRHPVLWRQFMPPSGYRRSLPAPLDSGSRPVMRVSDGPLDADALDCIHRRAVIRWLHRRQPNPETGPWWVPPRGHYRRWTADKLLAYIHGEEVELLREDGTRIWLGRGNLWESTAGWPIHSSATISWRTQDW